MSRVLLSAAALVAGLSVASAAAAASNAEIEKHYTPALQTCLDSDAGASTMGQIGCIGAELKIQDGRLNAAYRKAMGELTSGQKTKLQAAQRAWIAFRDADCAAQEDQDWGTMSRVFANDCVLSRTVERTIELEGYPPDGAAPAN